MGAWGHKAFENDSALDWLGELMRGDPSLVGEALDAVADSDDDEYLEVDEASAALAAAELVAAALGKGDDRLSDDAASWLAEHRAAARDVGARRARRAVQRVLESSELRELWDENGDDTEWHAEVRELLKRLA
jgi:hypothetical protein